MQVKTSKDSATGFVAIIAIHSTKLGPALGGCRYVEYPSIDSAIEDAIRLAQGMSYKAALAGLKLGGGKGVIMKPKSDLNRTAYFKAFGKFVNELNGQYITAVDAGTTAQDMEILNTETPYVANLANTDDADPSYYTAQGVMIGIRAAIKSKFGHDSLANKHIAIQGVGKVGSYLAEFLTKAGAKLTVSDTDLNLVQACAKKYNAKVVEWTEIHRVKSDVFSPCALGGVINTQTINEIQAPIIAGGANNQLSEQSLGKKLHQKGILYAPDYVINAGGVICAAALYYKTALNKISTDVENIYTSLTNIFTQAQQLDQSPHHIADQLAQAKL